MPVRHTTYLAHNGIYDRLFSTYFRQVDQVDLPKPWVFCLSYWVFLPCISKECLKTSKAQYFCFNIFTHSLMFWMFHPWFWYFGCFPLVFWSFLWIFAANYTKICRILEFFAWVLSFFFEFRVFSSLSFFGAVEKKPALICHCYYQCDQLKIFQAT